MEAIEDSIKRILPNVSNNVLQDVVTKLGSDGVDGVGDLEYVTAEDLKGLLRPIEIRKLLKCWRMIDGEKETVSETLTVGENAPTCSTGSPAAVPRSPGVNTGFIIGAQDPSWPHTLSVPWARLPATVLRQLEKGERLVGPARKKLLHLVVDTVHLVCPRPRRRQLEIIARKIHNAYPNAIVDKLNDTIIGSGYETLLKQLVARSENVNRQANPLRKGPAPAVNLEASQPPSTSLRRDSYGCINWQPELLDLDEVSLDAKKLQLKTMAAERPEEFPEEMFKATFALQRQDINGGVEIVDLKSQWPFLFSEKGLLIHFKELTGIDLKEKITSALREKSSRIFSFCKNAIKVPRVKALCAQIFGEMEEARNLSGTDRGAILAVVRLLMAYFGEEDDVIFCTFDEHIAAADLSERSLPSSPCLIGCGDSLLLARRFLLCCDKTVVVENIESSISSLCMLFAVFYCFNIQYPERAGATLEFIQRCFVGINPDRGSKVGRARNKKVSPMNPKVFTLVNSLADFEWTEGGSYQSGI